MTMDKVDSARRCLRDPISEIFEAAEFLKVAATAHLAGDRGSAAAAIVRADMPSIWDWTQNVMGVPDQRVLQLRPVNDAPQLIDKKDRLPIRMPRAAERRALIARDGYCCRFCGIPLIPGEVRKRIAIRYPDEVHWGVTNTPPPHSALFAMWLQYDHIVPHARGGTNDLDNLIVTCAPCNYGRINWTLAEVGLADPRLRPIQPTLWSGLREFR